jgi:hypothetical protein
MELGRALRIAIGRVLVESEKLRVSVRLAGWARRISEAHGETAAEGTGNRGLVAIGLAAMESRRTEQEIAGAVGRAAHGVGESIEEKRKGRPSRAALSSIGI